MKEFEKWDENNKVNYATFSGGQLSVKNERCKSWKAALEWIYKEAKQLEKHPESPIDAYNLIEQELGK